MISVNVTAAVAKTPPMISPAVWLTPIVLKSRIRASMTSVVIRLGPSFIVCPRAACRASCLIRRGYDTSAADT